MERCPPVEQLEQWLQGPADSPESHALAAHVDGCPHCQGVLEGLTADAAKPRSGASPAPRARPKPDPPERQPVSPVGGGSTFVSAGSLPRLEREIVALLRRRLRVVALLMAAVYATFGGLLWSGAAPPVFTNYSSLVGHALIVVGLLASAGCAAAVWLAPPLSLTALRVMELLIFGLTLAYAAWFRYAALTRGLDEPWEGPSHRLLYVTEITQVSNTFWAFAIICYGVFIPNTWRRCVAVVAVMALIPVALTLLIGLTHEVVRVRLPFLLSFTVLGQAVAAAVAVFGTFKISSLQQEAFAARQVGQYRLKERLGGGGMGEVYLAEHRLLKRPCTVKLIRAERASDPDLLRRFEREVQATAQLSHFNTVEIFDYGHTEDGTFYYVMEYLPGLSLDELVAREGPQPAARVVHFLRQLCGALREAHEAGLVHRDIKPSNVIVSRQGGQYDVAKLLDFGLVRSLDVGDAGETKLTKEGLILGTPDFMSPEQANGAASLDARSDLYSLGAVAYFLLTGRPPFSGRPVLQTLYAHLHEPPRPPADQRPDVPADLEAVVLRCLAKDPGQRFPDAASLEHALGRCACAGRWTEAEARKRWQEVSR
jgi:serine/threonine-protein kinase